ncbi:MULTISPECIES: hypothetical protein [Bradyrhizobium]|jgi:hypothetical protein|uniref:hypothetical protein n=1 Tax=Bradyrhizobium TaxID=374 RepID=UPI0004B8D86B|nr:hypothetical protein [Bradyrhizobium elkanii]MCP1972920.1 hypothetical protein [Bradyrhizobium elkanii]MCS3520117.1 hypothetical protein [Bradyrhizobium elkanii]MCS4067772.1 hypothetical protein [Bradyrhizobium elkanii]MCS4083308.1 hypothetical protein [Bradyrhizobium elkanii]MCS4105572.1 hypothetical protein [Bradyrhizobium elkanii]
MNIDIKADETRWRSTMLPEGFVTKWLVADGELAKEGHGFAVVRIEGALRATAA